MRELTRADLDALPWFVPIQMLDNMRFHLDDWLRWRGALALDSGYLDAELAALRQWDQDVLRPRAV